MSRSKKNSINSKVPAMVADGVVGDLLNVAGVTVPDPAVEVVPIVDTPMVEVVPAVVPATVAEVVPSFADLLMSEGQANFDILVSRAFALGNRGSIPVKVFKAYNLIDWYNGTYIRKITSMLYNVSLYCELMDHGKRNQANDCETAFMSLLREVKSFAGLTGHLCDGDKIHLVQSVRALRKAVADDPKKWPESVKVASFRKSVEWLLGLRQVGGAFVNKASSVEELDAITAKKEEERKIKQAQKEADRARKNAERETKKAIKATEADQKKRVAEIIKTYPGMAGVLLELANAGLSNLIINNTEAIARIAVVAGSEVVKE